MTLPISLTPVALVRSARKIPQDDLWNSVESWIELDGRFGAEALAGLEAFSHLEVVFVMDQVPDEDIQTHARHPRGNLAWPKVGIFSQRAKNRPNRLGLTVCRILAIDGTRIRVEGLDAVEGSPVLDLKPWVREFGPRGDIRQPEWMTELMERYWE
jgi:tRNA-Thr(GGU) m(6)t(6)A37 methyltransferase TsaA